MSAPKPNPARERHWICAQRLRERRLSLGLTQREVVVRLHQHGSCTTNRALSAMENGRGLDLGLLPELAASLSCSVTYLLGLTWNPESWAPDEQDGAPSTTPVPEPVFRTAGILGPGLPEGFLPPGRQGAGAQPGTPA
ncbi:helix-turn-helix domain-containing protein [Amycolatopsis pittospori]|uniref:helix-turn-helix domain-containing protein n=1 Tax=Amycolatopsis pittospori TaxID=2749434 RepID=UPI0015F03DB9|nr:helix-turn-helix transcriptional regulator [Amycolatopsis pittospori]